MLALAKRCRIRHVKHDEFCFKPPAVECPSDIVDAIGGWATSGIGQKYGTGYSLTIKNKWMKRIEVLGSSFDDQ